MKLVVKEKKGSKYKRALTIANGIFSLALIIALIALMVNIFLKTLGAESV